jgi:Arc/MetJ-type ribon-helix-helix transcriptional regulator
MKTFHGLLFNDYGSLGDKLLAAIDAEVNVRQKRGDFAGRSGVVRVAIVDFLQRNGRKTK